MTGIGKDGGWACLTALPELLTVARSSDIAVLGPPQLAEQWQSEMRDKFHIDAELVLPGTVTRLGKSDCRVPENRFSISTRLWWYRLTSSRATAAAAIFFVPARSWSLSTKRTPALTAVKAAVGDTRDGISSFWPSPLEGVRHSYSQYLRHRDSANEQSFRSLRPPLSGFR